MKAQSPIWFLFAALGLWVAARPQVPQSGPAMQNGPSPALVAKPQQSNSTRQARKFVPSAVISAADTRYPLQTTAGGIVVFDVSLDSRGNPTNIIPLTDIPPLTNAALASLRTWKFAPAWSDRVPRASQMIVAFVFRHAVMDGSPPALSPVFAPKEQAGYMPPGIFSTSYAGYPSNTIAAGAAVVQATIKADGIIRAVNVVRPMKGGFVPLALKAVMDWQFQPAMLNGTPVASNVAIAFVFSSRALNPF